MTAAGAQLRTLRVLTVGLGATTAVGVLATTLLIPEPEWLVFGDWYRGLVGLLAALPLVVGVGAPWAGVRLLRVLAAVIVAEYALLLTVITIAAVAGRVDGQFPWFLSVTAVPAGAALVAAGRLAAWIVLGAGTSLIQLIRILTDEHWMSAVANDVFAFCASAVLLLMFGLLIGVSRELDASIAHALEATRLRSAAEAEDRVRDRMRTLVHDELLYLLTSGARDAPALRDSVAAEAGRIRRAIADLHERPEPGASPEVPTSEVVDRLSAVAAHELPGAPCVVEATEGGIPAHVADAVEGALRQALVNVRHHAGADATASIALEVHGNRVHVSVRDDGAGFSAETVPPERMGIATSIVGRLSAIPGGSARVTSRPGAGTVVTIDWRQVEEAPASGEDRDGVLVGEGEHTRRGLLVAGAVFLLAQAGLAVLASVRAGDPWIPLLALAGVSVALFGIGWGVLERPSGPRARVVLSAAGATALLTLVPATRDPLHYGDLWYVPALGFVLLALAARGRPGYALLGGGAVAAIALVGLPILQNDPDDVIAATTRLIGVLGIGVCLAVATARIRRRVSAVRAAELEAVRTSTFEQASRRALRDRSRELEALVAPTLAALERGDALSPDERRECAALEGRLRDQYRAGRLGRPTLVRSAMAARRRGVDVALLDDGSDRTLTADELERVVAWMAGLLDTVTTGPVTGRILPAGRAAVASLVAGDDVALFSADDPVD